MVCSWRRGPQVAARQWGRIEWLGMRRQQQGTSAASHIILPHALWPVSSDNEKLPQTNVSLPQARYCLSSATKAGCRKLHRTATYTLTNRQRRSEFAASPAFPKPSDTMAFSLHASMSSTTLTEIRTALYIFLSALF